MSTEDPTIELNRQLIAAQKPGVLACMRRDLGAIGKAFSEASYVSRDEGQDTSTYTKAKYAIGKNGAALVAASKKTLRQVDKIINSFPVVPAFEEYKKLCTDLQKDLCMKDEDGEPELMEIESRAPDAPPQFMYRYTTENREKMLAESDRLVEEYAGAIDEVKAQDNSVVAYLNEIVEIPMHMIRWSDLPIKNGGQVQVLLTPMLLDIPEDLGDTAEAFVTTVDSLREVPIDSVE